MPLPVGAMSDFPPGVSSLTERHRVAVVVEVARQPAASGGLSAPHSAQTRAESASRSCSLEPMVAGKLLGLLTRGFGDDGGTGEADLTRHGGSSLK
jgi:hypothetical protein